MTGSALDVNQLPVKIAAENREFQAAEPAFRAVLQVDSRS
jgi:hypothetical protein